MAEVGQRVGDYCLEEPLGEGGFGEVWAASHVRLGHRVAIKFADTSEDPERRERFLREARLAASVKHRHVVEVIDFGSVGDETFMVMELATGRTWGDYIVDGDVDPELAVRVLTQLCKAVEACHRQGVVHRDLKPENVFVDVDEDGGVFVKLVDFGISKATAGAKEDGRRSAVPTREGHIIGTPEYMAPEQARGESDIDVRADVYSLGVMLYEAFCGELPYDGPNPGVVVARVLLGTCVPMVERRPDLPVVAALIDRAIEREREDRIETVRALRIQLQEAAQEDLQLDRDSWTGRIQIERLRPLLDEHARDAETRTHDTPVDELLAAEDPEPVTLPRRRGPLVGVAAAVVLLGVGAALWASTSGSAAVERVAEPNAAEPSSPADPSETLAALAPSRPDPAEEAMEAAGATTTTTAAEEGEADATEATETMAETTRMTVRRRRPARMRPAAVPDHSAPAPAVEPPAPSRMQAGSMGLVRSLDF